MRRMTLNFRAEEAFDIASQHGTAAQPKNIGIKFIKPGVRTAKCIINPYEAQHDGN